MVWYKNLLYPYLKDYFEIETIMFSVTKRKNDTKNRFILYPTTTHAIVLVLVTVVEL